MNRLIDLHIHPSLKMYYLPYLRGTFHAMVPSGGFRNPLSFRSQYANLKNSPEKVMLCAHYVIEKDFAREGLSNLIKTISWTMAPLFYLNLRRADPWKTVNGMMDLLEKSVPNTNRWVGKKGKRFKMLRTPDQIDTLAENEIGLVHAIEGAHALGYGPDKNESLEQFWEKVQQRLLILKRRGLAMITLAHFWDNPFSPQTEGTEWVPKKKNGAYVQVRDDFLSTMKRASWKWDDAQKLAEPFTRKLMELGILVDISHTQEHARWKVYELAEEYDRPVIASHVGLQAFFNHEYNLSDTEVRQLHKIGGIVGLILSRRWLVHPLEFVGSDGKGARDLVKSMRYIADLIGCVDNIGIGTDFDGLTDPFKESFKPDQFDPIVEEMAHYFTDDQIDLILYGNSLRALKKGWDGSEIEG